MKTKLQIFCILLITFSFSGQSAFSQSKKNPFVVIAYYIGNGEDISRFDVGKLTHIIYSFLHLNGNKLVVDNAGDSLTISKLVDLKKANPKLKIILSLGGWGGCPTCSDVFSSTEGREEFAKSALQLFEKYHADGLDLDWEYPAIESVPGYKFMPEDRQNFTSLIKTLRDTFGTKYELSFAAGGFDEFLEKSVEWDIVMPLLNYVNMMTYDFVNGYSRKTGHLTPLYSTPEQPESTDKAVRFLDSIGVPKEKIVIGLAFYARLFSQVKPQNNGLYQSGKFSGYMIFRDFETKMGEKEGYSHYWDSVAMAPYAYNPSTKTFATFDNEKSVCLKTKYAMKNKLGGVMFWELHGDKESGGLLEAISRALKE